jgi:DNA processing protein
VERFRREHGEAPQIKVPENVLLPGDQRWPQVMDRLDRLPVLLQSLVLGPLQPMA